MVIIFFLLRPQYMVFDPWANEPTITVEDLTELNQKIG